MSIIRSLCLNARTQDSTQASLTDTSNYGVSGNPARNTEAHWLLVAKMDENEQLVFNLTVVPDNTPLLSLNWTFQEDIDGAYRSIMFNPPFWASGNDFIGEIVNNGVIGTYGSIVWGNTTSQFYKCILSHTHTTPFEPGVTTGWQTYWSVITDWTTQIANPNCPIYIFDDVITFRYEDCLLKEIDCHVERELKGTCATIEQLEHVLSMQLLLDGIKSEDWQDMATKAETVVQKATKKYCC